MNKLIENRDLFITKKCFHTFSGYAHAQIEKASGANKMVNHPEQFEKPKKEDFCWIIPMSIVDGFPWYATRGLPCRPIPIKSYTNGLPLDKFNVAALEHVSNTYRLYFYDKEAKGVFRGDDMLVCQPIPLAEEEDRFFGLLIYNQQEYEKALSQHRKYREWVDNRNENRWLDQEKKLVQYDAKNMLHCMRLLMSGENILRHGVPLVRFEGEQRDYLMKIRAGEFKYEELMAEVEKRMAGMEEIYKTSTIPHSVNMGKIEKLYREVSNG